ncbi:MULTISPECIES: hypothetical protein [Kyrpidia]|uniref:Uncharacterized protein n=2 Tax=Kyrpidia spormannii TaxID=2055160 RepID=A0A6F9EE83_9BACL|nr:MULTISPECIES: hypothetical protein [Kyrpidia]MCL6574909.1 hypothetical protein [Kyrpidia sp.]CAB3393797.1 protein of unknown function [Kyrpidia spormannii]CAB3394721.1 protein of unknown function [Kyrpidia spormannii]HHY68300.1 hypothetical protein [Alicyclobacillus sp.]
MRKKPVRRHYRGVKYFYFDIADPSHARITKYLHRETPEQLIGELTRNDEY